MRAVLQEVGEPVAQRVIAGRYELQQLLGRGGMGEVWAARDCVMERSVAVKLLQAHLGTAEGEELFFREARTAGALSHPGIVTVHDLGRDGDGTLYLVMEKVPGRNLGFVLQDGLPPVADILAWTAQTADALHAAHSVRILHRDLKPANLMLTPSGSVKILDFGIARYISTLTVASRVVGTIAYMPPERLLGKVGDARGDLYSLGCVLYELLTGRTPFGGLDTPALMYAHVHTPPPPPSSHRPGLPPHLDALLAELLAKEPGDRPASAAEVRDHLSHPPASSLAEQSARAVETRAAARAEKLLAEAQEEAAQIRRRAQQHVTPQGSELAVPDRALGPAKVLRLSLVNEFRTLTEPGSENCQALVRPELARSAEPVTLLRPDLGGLWRTLHLLALRLPVEDAARLRTRWRAMATDLFYGVDGDGLVPGLPGVVEPLPLRAPESVMTQLAIRDHAKALLARGGVTDVEMAGKLRYLFALIQEHASENRLLAQYDSGLVVALESLTGGNVRRIGTGDVMDQYLRQVDAQLADLALSATHAPLHQHTLVNADEALAALLPDPVPSRDSWWHHRRRALQKKLTPYLASSGFEIQAHGTLPAVASDQTKKTNIASDKRTGDAILWWLRLPYRTQHGSWQKGRMIHEKLR
ncbi:protein kinase [Streptomyces sp. NPDC092370]|uniref:serine/threonine-protein kinase n=1 Tax=Streptomyces sp. NPDC092370 TaxID=3366016 RepID=UPI003830E0D0